MEGGAGLGCGGGAAAFSPLRWLNPQEFGIWHAGWPKAAVESLWRESSVPESEKRPHPPSKQQPRC